MEYAKRVNRNQLQQAGSMHSHGIATVECFYCVNTTEGRPRWLCSLFSHEITETDTDNDLYTISRTVPPQNAAELHYIDSITRQVHLVPFYKDLYQEENEQKAPPRELIPCGQGPLPNYVVIPMWEVR